VKEQLRKVKSWWKR